MKKVLFILLISLVTMASTTKKNDNIANNAKEVKVEMSTSENVENNIHLGTDIVDSITRDAGCSEQANGWYKIYREMGYNHRDARTLRRAWVRDCRGGPVFDWPWE